MMRSRSVTCGFVGLALVFVAPAVWSADGGRSPIGAVARAGEIVDASPYDVEAGGIILSSRSEIDTVPVVELNVGSVVGEFFFEGEDVASVLAEMAGSSSDLMDAANYTNWVNHYGEVGENTPGDFDHNGVVDIIDKLYWAAYFGHEFPPSAEANSSTAHDTGSSDIRTRNVGPRQTLSLMFAAVPEPSGSAMATIALLGLTVFAGKRRRRV